MEFNKNWTKEDNDQLRQLIKEGKNVDYIRDYFGNDKLFYHPNKKYYHSGKSIPNFIYLDPKTGEQFSINNLNYGENGEKLS